MKKPDAEFLDALDTYIDLRISRLFNPPTPEAIQKARETLTAAVIDILYEYNPALEDR